VFFNNGLCIVPNVNLIRNAGQGIDATNCLYENKLFANIQYGRLKFPLLHPDYISLDKKTNSMDSHFYMKEKRIGLKK
jgi:hypothetical protein